MVAHGLSYPTAYASGLRGCKHLYLCTNINKDGGPTALCCSYVVDYTQKHISPFSVCMCVSMFACLCVSVCASLVCVGACVCVCVRLGVLLGVRCLFWPLVCVGAYKCSGTQTLHFLVRQKGR